MKNVIVDPDFKDLIPPLAEDERQRLEESLKADGCMDTVKLWNGTIVDGHNRYEICTRLGIPFRTEELEFESRTAAMLWMIDNQLARRNVGTADRILLAKKKEPLLKTIAKARQAEYHGNQYEKCTVISSDKSPLSNSDSIEEADKLLEEAMALRPPKEKNKPVHVQQEIAKIAGVSTGTIGKFDVIEKKKPELIEDIRSKKLTIDAAYKQVKNEEKKAEVLEAERSVQAQVSEAEKPVLYIGDSTTFTPAEKYDLLLTDPPYSTDVDNIDAFVDSWLYNALENVKDTGFAYVFIGAYPEEVKAYLCARLPAHISLCQQLIWTYKNTLGNNPKDRYKQNYQVCLFYRGTNAPDLDCPLTSEQWAVQEINAPDGRQGDRYHAWQKPMEIAERFIRHSTKQGMTVYDPFACTGTFLLAAAKLGRKAYGYEIDIENANIAGSRGCVIKMPH